MAKVNFSISQRDKSQEKRELLIRFVYGNGLAIRCKSGIFVYAQFWSDKKQAYNFPSVMDKKMLDECKSTKETISKLKTHIENSFADVRLEDINKDWLITIIDKWHNPDKYKPKEPEKITFFMAFDKYLSQSTFSESRLKHFKVLYRTLQRYEKYNNLSLDLETITAEELQDFEKFLKEEYQLIDEPKYQKVFKKFPEYRNPKQRGENYVKGLFVLYRCFFRWCKNKGITNNYPFGEGLYVIDECVYGTPIYITLEEMATIYKTDLSSDKQLETQRDIFIFQSLIGCRVGDLYSFTESNLIDGTLQYIPSKTKDERGVTIIVPLNDTALEIIKKYENQERKTLLPFISEQQYNQYIKKVFRECGINRMVTIINPTTSKEEQVAISEVASSHMARRTFVGNLYKHVQDPNLIGSMTGHKEGSKAFARYRSVDTAIKKKVVNLLDIK